jgi:carbonic anhydrase/acetyltransferase-like protein (isoleucine patch superfamily)
MLHPVNGKYPELHPTSYCSASAEIIGDVHLEANTSVWFRAVLRGDINAIRIGEGTNIQDGSILHVRSEAPLIIGKRCTLGHGVIAHACTIDDHCLIGMGAIVLDNARVNSYTLVAAGSVVRQGDVLPQGVLAAGAPAKVVRSLTDEERTMIEESARQYIAYATMYRAG